MWQGSFIANYTRGHLISSTFREIGFDAYTLGNPDLDWGVEVAIENEAPEYLGQKILAANVYDYPKTGSTWTKSDFGDVSRVVTYKPGTADEVKVGIIGVIGSSQFSSITASNTADFVFLNPTNIVNTEADRLRSEEGCDVVVASYHAGQADVDTAVTSHVDAIFCGHTHRGESKEVNGVPFIQGAAYGQNASEVRLLLNRSEGTVSAENYQNVALANLSLSEDEATVQALLDLQESPDVYDKLHVSLGYTDSYFTNTTNLAMYQERVTAEKAESLGYEFDYCMFNQARASMRSGPTTYSDIFMSHPFLNSLYIARVSGADLINEASYNYLYLNNGAPIPTDSSSVYYTVLVYDYLLFHNKLNNSYQKIRDYFPSFETSGFTPELVMNGDIKLTVVDAMVEDYQARGTIYPSDYMDGGTYYDCFYSA